MIVHFYTCWKFAKHWSRPLVVYPRQEICAISQWTIHMRNFSFDFSRNIPKQTLTNQQRLYVHETIICKEKSK